MGNTPGSESDKGQLDEVKVMLCGPDGSGKTSLVFACVPNKRPKDNDPTIEDAYRRFVPSNQKWQEIFDTTGSMNDRRRTYLQQAHGCIITYSLPTSEATQDILERNIQEILEFTNIEHIVIVGTKADLWEERNPENTVGASVARRHGFHHFRKSIKF
jgi:GTPase SAR1 family protein